jgi:hypothetical protein
MLKTGIGFAAGLLAGWLLFGMRDDEGARAPKTEPKRVAPVPPPEQPRESGADRHAPPAHAVSRVLTAGSVSGDARRALEHWAHRIRQGEVEVEAAAIDALIERIDTARGERDWDLFVALAQLLAVANTPRTQAKLLALMDDDSLELFDWRIAEHFWAGLADSELEGIAAAARRRIAMVEERHPKSDRWVKDWFALVARHGSEADIEWLAAHRERHTEIRFWEALAKSAKNPAAARKFMELWKAGGTRAFGDRAIRTFATTSPAVAEPFLRELLVDVHPGDDRASGIARAYGHAVNEANLPAARSFLLGLADPKTRTLAAHAVSAMAQRELDISGLEPILLAPVEEAERLVHATEKERQEGYYRVMYGIEYNRPTWSPRAVRALENLAAAMENQHTGDALRNVAKNIRAQIAPDDDGWRRTR